MSHMEPREWAKIMAINMTAAYRLIRSFEPLLRASDAGRAIFFTSNVVDNPRAFWGAYAASKAGLEAMVQCWADELENTSIRAALVNPGRVRTRMRAEAYPGEDASVLTDPAEIAPLVVELANPELTPPKGVVDFSAWKSGPSVSALV